MTSKLDDLQHQLDERRAAEQRKADEQRQAPPAEPATNNGPAVPAIPPAATPEAVVAEAPSGRPNRTLLIAGATAAGVGVAALAGGVACGVLARENSDELTRAAQAMQPFDSSKQRAGKTEQTAEIALFAVGGAVAVTGIVLLVVSRSHGHRAVRAQLAPTINSSVGALTKVQF